MKGSISKSANTKEGKNPSNGNDSSRNSEYLVYRRRWMVVTLYALYCAMNAAQWLQYSIIADVMTEYYDVSYSAISWTGTIFMATYVPCIFPATWLLNNKGLRLSIIIGSAGNCLACWIKVLAVDPDRFWLVMLGQGVAAVAQAWSLSMPSAVAATWFGPSQVGTACAIGVFGLQLGHMIGFLVPPLMVNNNPDPEVVGADLSLMLYAMAIAATVLLFFVVIFIKSKPPTPPSLAQAMKMEKFNENGVIENETVQEFVQAIWRILRNHNFLILFIGFGLNEGAFCGVSVFLNQIVLHHFPGGGKHAGGIGVTFILGAIVGTLACGYLLDWKKKFKETLVGVYVLSVISMLVYAFIMTVGSIIYVYIVAALLGFFLVGYVPVGLEIGAELTYPEPEANSSGVLMLGSQAFAVAFTVLTGTLLEPHPGGRVSNLMLTGILLVGTVLSLLVKPHFGRQAASQQEHQVIQAPSEGISPEPISIEVQ